MLKREFPKHLLEDLRRELPDIFEHLQKYAARNDVYSLEHILNVLAGRASCWMCCSEAVKAFKEKRENDVLEAAKKALRIDEIRCAISRHMIESL